MKKIDTSFASATVAQPFRSESLQFIQDSYTEAVNALGQSKIGSNYAANKAYILYGCVRSGAADGAASSAGSVSAGAVFYNGEVFLVPLANYTINLNYAVANIVTTNLSIDPVLFSNSTTHSVHNIRQIVITAGASGSGGVSNFKNFVAQDKIRTTILPANASVSSLTYVDLVGSSYTTPDDGLTRNYLILYRGIMNQASSAGDGLLAKIYNSTLSTDLDISEAYLDIIIQNVDLNRCAVNCQYYGPIAPNTTIKIQTLSTNGGALGLNKNSIVILEQ